MKSILLKFFVIITIFFPSINGCAYQSKKWGDPTDINLNSIELYDEVAKFLEKKRAKLEIPNIDQKGPSIHTKFLSATLIVNKLNSLVNPDYNYQKKYRLYIKQESELPVHPIVTIPWGWAFIFSFGLIPYPTCGSQDITTVGVLLDVSSDKMELGEEIGRFKNTLRPRCYYSMFIPSAWLVGSSSKYEKKWESPFKKSSDEDLFTSKSYREIEIQLKERSVLKGLLNIVKQLSRESADVQND